MFCVPNSRQIPKEYFRRGIITNKQRIPASSAIISAPPAPRQNHVIVFKNEASIQAKLWWWGGSSGVAPAAYTGSIVVVSYRSIW